MAEVIPENLALSFDNFCKDCDKCEVTTRTILNYETVSCRHFGACNGLYERIKGGSENEEKS